MAIALVTNVLAPYRVPLYALLAERYGVEVLCFGADASYVPEWLGDLDGQLAAAPFPARRIAGPHAALALGRRFDAAIAPVAGGAMLPATYLGMHLRGRPFVLWGSVWAHPRGVKGGLGFPLVRHVYRHADAVVTYGEHVRRYVGRYRGREDDVVIAPQSVEAELFGRAVDADEIAGWRAESGLGEGPLVLYVGRLVEEKGVRVLLDAWRLLSAGAAGAAGGAVAGAPAPTLVAIGDGPLAGELAATPGARLLGPLARERLPVAYAAAATLVLPSIPTPRFREPWGLVCNEALHQGTPVVATTAVGAVAGGLVRPEQTGLVVAPGDARPLADAIARLLADPTLRARLGTAGRDALAGHTYGAMADAFGVALARAGALA